MIKRICAAFAAFFVVGTIVATTPASAVPLICVMPTSGTVPGLTLVIDINSCFGTALGLFAAGSAPDSPAAGMLWWNTSTGYVAQWDGPGWNNLWNVDTTNHLNAVQIGGGVQASLAGASVIDLWSVPAASVAVTGTSTITQLANGHAVPGTVKIVTFAGALTLTQGGGTGGTPLNLPNNGSNIVTAAGDYAIVLALTSTNVQVIHYERATGAALSTAGLNVGASALGASALASFQQPVNLQINTTNPSNQLMVAIKGVNGADPSPTNPVLVGFRSQTGSPNGVNIFGALTGALSFTLAATSSMGCTTAVACRLWVTLICQTETSGACNSTGGGGSSSAILVGLSNQSTPTQVFPLGDEKLQTTGPNTTGDINPGIIQTSVASLSGKAVVIIGYIEATWTSGTGWAAPSKVQLFGPGVHKPGDVVQSVSLSTGGSSTQSTSGFVASNVSGTITPTSTINPIRVRMTAAIVASANSGGNELIGTQVYRGISGSFTAIGQQYNTGLASPGAGSSYQGNVISLPSDLPGTTSPVTYTLYFNSAAPGHNVSVLNGEGELIEIMGALDLEKMLPANDDAAPLRLVG